MSLPDRSVDGPPEYQQRLRELGRVSGELLHDLAGMLSVLDGRVTLALDEASRGQVATEDLTRIQEDMRELRQMVIEMLGELQGGRHSPEVTFPVTESVEEVVNRWLVGAPAVTVSLDSSLPERSEVVGPRSYFVRIMINLLRNAARHARGRVRLAISPIRDGRWVEILVDDDGHGVPDELAPGIFEPFVSGTPAGNEPGTGLGLSFASWATQRLGGELTFEGPAKGLGGASFRILLPLTALSRQAEQPRPGAAGTEKDPPSARKRRVTDGPVSGLFVMVVDDDQAVRRVFARLLERAGARAGELDPDDGGTAEGVVERLQRENPDVILLDLNLGRMSGLEVYDVLARENPSLAERVLFLTGGVAPHPAPERPVVNKLVTWDELATRIRDVAAQDSPST